jgi:hypothetical protein
LPLVNECKSIGGSGSANQFTNCDSDSQCSFSFGCDVQASGFKSNECLSDRNQNCGSDRDCVNNLVCKESQCRCNVNFWKIFHFLKL